MEKVLNNAYRVRIRSAIELSDFKKDLAARFQAHCVDKFTTEYALPALFDIIETLPWCKKYDPNLFIYKIREMSRQSGDRYGAENASAAKIYDMKVIDAAIRLAFGRFESDKPGTAKIYAFPQDEYVLFIPRGLFLERFVLDESRREPGPAMRDFNIEKPGFRIEGYGYDDDLNDAETDMRRNAWKRAMETDTIENDSIEMTIYESNRLEGYMKTYLHDGKAHDQDDMTPFEALLLKEAANKAVNDRINVQAKKMAFKKYAAETGVYTDNASNKTKSRIRTEFEERYKISGSRANEIYANTCAEIGDCYVDFENTDATAKAFMTVKDLLNINSEK